MEHRNSQLNRRRFLAAAGAGTLGLATGLPGVAQAQPSRMVMATGGGAIEDAYRKTVFAPWKEKTGIDIITTGNEGARLKAMVEQGKTEWDVLQGPAEEVIVYARQGLLEKLDASKLDKTQMFPGSVHEHFVLTDFAAYCIAWNKENVKTNPPKDWKELWALKGRIGLWKRPFQTLEVALLADGVALKDLYPLDVERALKSLDTIKSKIVWWARGAQGAQLLLDGEVEAGAIWNGRVHAPRLAGAPVDFTLNQSILVSDAWAIPKSAPNAAKAQDLVALGSTAAAQAAFAKELPYGPANKAALALLGDDIKKNLPQPGDSNRILDIEYWAANGAAVNERFNKWLLA